MGTHKSSGLYEQGPKTAILAEQKPWKDSRNTNHRTLICLRKSNRATPYIDQSWLLKATKKQHRELADETTCHCLSCLLAVRDKNSLSSWHGVCLMPLCTSLLSAGPDCAAAPAGQAGRVLLPVLTPQGMLLSSDGIIWSLKRRAMLHCLLLLNSLPASTSTSLIFQDFCCWSKKPLVKTLLQFPLPAQRFLSDRQNQGNVKKTRDKRRKGLLAQSKFLGLYQISRWQNKWFPPSVQIECLFLRTWDIC